MTGRALLIMGGSLIYLFVVDDGGDGTFELGVFSSTAAAAAAAAATAAAATASV